MGFLIREEMGLSVAKVANHPSYFLTDITDTGMWFANVLFETELVSLDFTPSDECTEVMFANLEDIKTLTVYSNVLKFAEMFDLGGYGIW